MIKNSEVVKTSEFFYLNAAITAMIPKTNMTVPAILLTSHPPLGMYGISMDDTPHARLEAGRRFIRRPSFILTDSASRSIKMRC
jgi:hypothetical protein